MVNKEAKSLAFLGLEGCGLDSKSAFPISFSTLCLSLQSAALSIDPCNEDAVAHVLSQIIKDENIRLSNTDRYRRVFSHLMRKHVR